MKIVIGCDPDAKAHGIAIYYDGVLTHLKSMDTLELYEHLKPLKAKAESIRANVENVKARRAAWHGGGVGGAIDVGKCHQAQTELERVFKALDIPVKLCGISNRWKSQAEKKQFQLATGWKDKSNEDARSAAWFGFTG